MTKVLVVVDMQRDFVTGPLGSEEAEAIVPYIADKVKNAHQLGDQVIFTKDTHEDNYLSTQEGQHLPVPHCIEYTLGHELVPALHNLIDFQDDLILNKPTFGSNDLVDELKFIEEAVGEIDEIEIVGVCTGICVIANAVLLKTNFTETKISVDAKGCACVTPESHENALAAMKLLQVEIKE